MTRFLAVTSAGGLVIYDAAIPPGGDSDNPGFVAYWSDFETESLYVFDRLLFTPDDVAVDIGSLERDFRLDPALFAVASPFMGGAFAPETGRDRGVNSPPDTTSDDPGVSRISSDDPPESPLGKGGGEGTILVLERSEGDDGSWRPASRELVFAVMGFALDDEGEGGVAARGWCDCICCLLCGRPSGPLPGPPPGASPDAIFHLASLSAGCPPPGGCTGPCCGSSNPCCGSSDPCCGSTNPCCGSSDPCCGSTNPCCGNSDPCCGDPVCCGDPCCNDRCCQGSSCCHSPNPCCNPLDRCCGNPDPCCNPDNVLCIDPCNGNPCCGDPCCGKPCCTGPCCDSTNPCCGSTDPCCDNTSDCCGDSNRCCGLDNPCCGSDDPCCGSTDECCNPDNPCCGTGQGPCCQSSDPCCNNPDPCCDPNPVATAAPDPCCNSIDPCCGVICEESPDNPCTDSWCISDPDSPQRGQCASRCTTVTIGPPLPPNAIRKKAIIVPANEDDDDDNHVMDSDQADPAPAGEDDLKAVPVTCGTQGTLRLSCSGCGRVRLWKNENRTDPFDLGTCWSSCEPGCDPIANRPTIIYVEGIQASAGDGDIVLSATFTKRDAACKFECICTDTAPLTVVSLREGSLTWELAENTGNPALGNCDNNGGKKIFPDLIDPNDGANAAKRHTVDLVATIKPPVEGATVYFKVWDVDDPFDQIHGPQGLNDIPNVGLIDPDNPTSGPDNRPPPSEPPWTAPPATTGTDGKARVTFTVSMQPGNNYRAGASVNVDAPGQADQTKADAADDEFVGKPGDFAEYKVPLTWSPMLTVWRKLHVETDTMVRPTFNQNTVLWSWQTPRQGPAASQIVFDVIDQFEYLFVSASDQFLNGFAELRTSVGDSLVTARVIGYVDVRDAPDTVTINVPDCGNGHSGLQCLQGVASGSVALSDDDLADLNTFSQQIWGCDDLYANPVASLAPPDLSLLVDRYKPAYIEPVQDTQASAVQGLTIFLRNWSEADDHGKALWDQALAARNLPVSTSSFWTAMVVSAWQAEENQDADPDSEDQVGVGVTKGVNTHYESALGDTATTSSIIGIGNYTGICAVFKAVFGESAFTQLERYTVAHEIGHTFGLDHSDGGAMCKRGDCQTEPFTSASLKKLREYVQP